MLLTNNDILRRLRFTFDFSDDQMMALFKLADRDVTRAMVSSWMKKDNDSDYQVMRDIDLAVFLNGLIIDKRGKREGSEPKPEQKLNNNIIFRKLKIALRLQYSDIQDIYKLVGKDVSEHEISAFFRKPGQNQYRVCQDQFLRNFIYGLQVKFRNINEGLS